MISERVGEGEKLEGEREGGNLFFFLSYIVSTQTSHLPCDNSSIDAFVPPTTEHC